MEYIFHIATLVPENGPHVSRGMGENQIEGPLPFNQARKVIRYIFFTLNTSMERLIQIPSAKHPIIKTNKKFICILTWPTSCEVITTT